MSDWYDKQACHTGNVQVWDRSNGRIYRISHRNAKPVVGIDLQKKTDAELVEYQLHENEWYVRHSRRILQERAIGKDRGKVFNALRKILQEEKDETRRLRALWACHAYLGEFFEISAPRSPSSLEIAMKDKSPYVRAWAVQLELDKDFLDSVTPLSIGQIGKFRDLAKNDPSSTVRLYLAS